MGENEVSRRSFMKKAGTLAAATAAVYSWEEHNLLAHQEPPPPGGAPGRPQGRGAGGRGGGPVADVPGPMPMGKLGNLQVSRLIAGHNLVVGQAHSRDLLYTSALLRAYFTEAKILETFAMFEKKGINTSLARMAPQMIDPVKKYMKEGGKLQWFAGISAAQDGSITRDLDLALDMGCKGGYVHGNTGDALFKAKNIDAIGKAVETMKKAGLVAGIGSHLLDVCLACDKAGIKPDYYLKTFNAGTYWSAGPPKEPDPKWKPTDTDLAQAELGGWGSHNNLWDTTPKQTAAFMANTKVPWIGFKVMGAGAISPREAFKYSFQNGCDFIAVGMYDFQVTDNANILKQVLVVDKETLGRTRAWLG